MHSIPQLKVRTEYSFKKAYGPVKEVAERLRKIGCSSAGIVDFPGTWGHVKWEKALKENEISPMFGIEMSVENGDRKSQAWALAENLKQFYNFTSSSPKTQEDWAGAKGIVRFSGNALTDPECFDFVDINPSSILATKQRLALAKRLNKPLVLTSDNDYPGPEDEEKFLAWVDNKRMTPQHILTPAEFRSAFHFLDDSTYEKALKNTIEVAERTQGQELNVAPIIKVAGDLKKLVQEGRDYRITQGHIKDWTKEYQQRLKREMEMIYKKAYQSYFICVADLVAWAKTKMLVGPARGSSAGSLVCYLLRITEVDPIPYGLLFERFIDINRDDLPDIDIDFNDVKREMVFDYLSDKYNPENVAKIGNVQTLKPRSVMAHVGKKMGINAGATFPVINVLIEYSSGDSRYGKGLEDTLNNTQPGKKFQQMYPEAMVMGSLENHASHTGVHAAGIIVCNVPVIDYCTVQNGVAQVDKKDAEHLNLLKIDALGLRTLGVIEDSGVVDNEMLYALPLNDENVFSIFNEAKFSGVFQFEGAAQRRVSIQVPIDVFRKIDHVTALARPGPLGGGAANHYINRNAGREEITYRHQSMQEYLGDTMGVVLYQEQVMRIVREIGNFSWEETSVIRKAMSGRKGKEFFDKRGEMFAEGAARLGISNKEAADIWNEICNFGAWGMNKSHTTSYAMISYWCAYMKHYHPLEYAASCLRHAKDDDQVIEILRELRDEGISYTPFDAQLSEQNWSAKDGKLVGGYMNLHGIGPAKSVKYIEKRNTTGLDEKDLAQLAKHKIKNDDLSPGRTLWGDIYDNPSDYNIMGRVDYFSQLQDWDVSVVICKMIRKERRDENETVRLARRNGKRKTGQTQFLDMFVVDDSVSKPVVLRVKCNLWNSIGEKLADRAVDNEDWFLVRGKWMQQFSMMSVIKIKCLTNSRIFENET